MKRLFILLILPLFLFAEQVSIEEAQTIATNWYEQTLGHSSAIQNYKGETIDGYPAYYVFNFTEGGFVVVSGNDAAYPVLGFSETGQFDFDMANPSLQKFMEDYKREIRYIVENKISNSKTIEYWQSIKNPVPTLYKKTEDKVSPF